MKTLLALLFLIPSLSCGLTFKDGNQVNDGLTESISEKYTLSKKNFTLPLDVSSGVISGTPSVNSTLTSYTVFGNNTGGSSNTSVSITINEPTPNIGSISDQVFTRDTAITNIVATNSGGNAQTWEV